MYCRNLVVVVLCIIFVCSSAYAEGEVTKGTQLFHLVANFALDFGGEKMIDVEYESGNSNDIRAGEMMSIDAGFLYRNVSKSPNNFEAQMTFGYKFKSSNAKNGDIKWTRFPVDVLFFAKQVNWRVGAGITYHMNPTVDGSGVASGLDLSFDDSLGYLLEIDYLFNNKVFFGARGTIIDYKVNGFEISGNSIGAILGLIF